MLVIVGGAGSGKTTVLKALEGKGYRRIVTYTTRPPRENEVDGIDYNFVTYERFCQLEKKNYFVETSEYEAVERRILSGAGDTVFEDIAA